MVQRALAVTPLACAPRVGRQGCCPWLSGALLCVSESQISKSKSTHFSGQRRAQAAALGQLPAVMHRHRRNKPVAFAAPALEPNSSVPCRCWSTGGRRATARCCSARRSRCWTSWSALWARWACATTAWTAAPPWPGGPSSQFWWHSLLQQGMARRACFGAPFLSRAMSWHVPDMLLRLPDPGLCTGHHHACVCQCMHDATCQQVSRPLSAVPQSTSGCRTQSARA